MKEQISPSEAPESENVWWKTMFDEKYLDTYLSTLTPERTSSEVDFIVKAGNLKPDEKILDLACGHGRHDIELAKRGFSHITGVDYSETFINKAVHDASEHGVKVDFQRGDMRNLGFENEFDVVLTLFTTFGYFDDKGNRNVLKEIHKSLKPGGSFLIDVISGEAVQRRFKEKGVKDEKTNLLVIPRTQEMNGRSVEEIEWFDSEKQLIHNHREWLEDGKKREYDYYLTVYTIPQYREMFSEAGFEIEDIWGDFEGNPHNFEGNYRTIIFARKK